MHTIPMHTIPVITYHAIGEAASPLFTPPARFEATLAHLAEAGYRTVSLQRVLGWLRSGAAFPAKTVVLAFDDGYRSVYGEAWPRLAAYGFTATVFLVTGYCGRDNRWPGQPAHAPRLPLLSWAEADKLTNAGWELGAHTCTHPPLPLVDAARVEQEVAESQAAIQARTGQAAAVFAYPYGARNAAVEAIVAQHCAGAVSTDMGLVTATGHPYRLARIDAYYWRPQAITAVNSPVFRGYLRLRDALRKLRRCVYTDWQGSGSLSRPASGPAA